MNHFDTIAAALEDRGLDAMLLTGEANRFYASGFHSSGTDGVSLVTRSGAYYFTDSRYIEAAGRYVQGAFTSAIKQHKGKFEQADGGTLFLDEIGDMSLAAQAKVLRVLQEKKLSRVGSDKDIIVDVRVLAATNKNLKDEIEKGHFREDLYHRLSVIVINVPTLDQRKSDIPLLVDYFIGQICSETGMPPREIDADAMQLLVEKSWTGNIRELRNVVERLLILSGERITADDVKAYVL